MPKGIYKRKPKAITKLVAKEEGQLSVEEMDKIRRVTELFDAIRVLERYGMLNQADALALIRRVMTT